MTDAVRMGQGCGPRHKRPSYRTKWRWVDGRARQSGDNTLRYETGDGGQADPANRQMT